MANGRHEPLSGVPDRDADSNHPLLYSAAAGGLFDRRHSVSLLAQYLADATRRASGDDPCPVGRCAKDRPGGLNVAGMLNSIERVAVYDSQSGVVGRGLRACLVPNLLAFGSVPD